MTLEKYMEEMMELIKERPEVLKYKVITAKDDEGNGFDEVCWGPSISIFTEDGECIGIDDEEYIEELREDGQDVKPNAVCLN